MSYQTEKAYVQWVKRFIRYFKMQHPEALGAGDVSEFLSYLASERKVSAATQNQALNSPCFLYRHMPFKDLGTLPAITRTRRPRNIPVVLSREEILTDPMRIKSSRSARQQGANHSLAGHIITEWLD